MECHTGARGLFGKLSELVGCYRKKCGACDAVLVTFPGTHLMPLAWVLTRFPRKTLMYDAFISLHDTLVVDRKLLSRWNPAAWMVFVLDWLACRMADNIFTDTEAHRTYFAKTFGADVGCIRAVALGTRDDLFYPKTTPRRGGNFLEVFFYGTFIPLHGIEHILKAAKILQDKEKTVHFTLLGKGQTEQAMRAYANELQVQNVTFKNPVAYEELPDWIRGSDLCLGIFSTSEKALRVVPHKVYDVIACGVPILTARTPAMKEQFSESDKILLCDAGSGEAIAEAIESFLASHPSSR
jgi:glycosyltransferase involved in cell wall biosynthesis